MSTTRYICLQSIIVLIEHTYFLHGGADGIHTEPYTQGNLQAHLDNGMSTLFSTKKIRSSISFVFNR